jgi:hypothetical protein
MIEPDGSADELGEAMKQLDEIVAKRRLARPGTRDDRQLLDEQERLTSRVATLSRLQRMRQDQR